MRSIASVRDFICIAVVLAVSVPALAQSKKEKRLDAGEVIITTKNVDGFDIPKVHLEAVINAAPEKVWAIIEKCGDYTRTMVGLAEAKELSRKGNQIRCKTVADLPWPLDDLTAITKVRHTVIANKKWQRTWSLESGDFKYNYGSWKLSHFKGDPQRTHLVYSAHVEPTTTVPDSIKTAAAKSTLPNLIAHLRKQLEKS